MQPQPVRKSVWSAQNALESQYGLHKMLSEWPPCLAHQLKRSNRACAFWTKPSAWATVHVYWWWEGTSCNPMRQITLICIVHFASQHSTTSKLVGPWLVEASLGAQHETITIMEALSALFCSRCLPAMYAYSTIYFNGPSMLYISCRVFFKCLIAMTQA